MNLKTQTDIFVMLLKHATWTQVPWDEDLSLITIIIPNRNVRRTESLQGKEAVHRILKFSCGFLFDTLIMHAEETRLDILYVDLYKSVKESLQTCLKRVSESL